MLSAVSLIFPALRFISGLWSSEFGRVLIVGLGCLIGGWMWGWSHEHAVKVRAVQEATASRDAAWTANLAKANAEHERKLQEALDAARKISDTPLARSDLVRLCAKSASCRPAPTGRELPIAEGHMVPRRHP